MGVFPYERKLWFSKPTPKPTPVQGRKYLVTCACCNTAGTQRAVQLRFTLHQQSFMPIKYHPEAGAILVCDFRGFEAPEMQKKRPVVVVSPRLRHRTDLCTVVPLSTSAPQNVCQYHLELETNPPLPAPYNSDKHWVKADMVYSVSFDRLSALFVGKDERGVRVYDFRVISEADLQRVRVAMLHGLGLPHLTDKV